jgi:hypothetical protein
MSENIETSVETPVISEDVKAEPNITETAADDVVNEVKQEEPKKTFTQEEVNDMVQKRLLKEERKVQRRVEQQMREQAQQAAIQREPERTEFRDDEAYLKAQIEHLAEKRATEKLAEREAAKEAERRSESFIEKAEKASERYADFQEVVSNPSLNINTDMAEFISESEHGADVAYYLGKHPMKAAQIAQMSPIKAARELTRLEAEVSAKPVVKTSNAPAPIEPIGNRGSVQTSLANADFAEYKKMRMAQNPSWRR